MKNHEIHATVVQNQGSTKSIGNTSWMSPGSIFEDFGVDLGGPGVIFESLGASVPKVIFKTILGRARTEAILAPPIRGLIRGLVAA